MNKEEIKKIINEHKNILKKYKVKSIALFGSFVRNEQKGDSDIDFLIVFDEGTTLFDIVDLQYNLSKILKKKVSIVSKGGLSKYIGPHILKEAETIGEGF